MAAPSRQPGPTWDGNDANYWFRWTPSSSPRPRAGDSTSTWRMN